MSCTRYNRCENSAGYDTISRIGGCGGDDGREYNCPLDRQVVKHRHVVKHKHDIFHEYDVIHQHDYHYYDVVTTREESQHHDHRNHRPEYCTDCANNSSEGCTECGG